VTATATHWPSIGSASCTKPCAIWPRSAAFSDEAATSIWTQGGSPRLDGTAVGSTVSPWSPPPVNRLRTTMIRTIPTTTAMISGALLLRGCIMLSVSPPNR
jgi:hypothetical protein